MWVFLSDAFLSIVEHRDTPEYLLVRAHFAGDIERAFKGAVLVTEATTRDADFPYWAEVRREAVAAVLAEHVRTIDYDNFKATVPAAAIDRYREGWIAEMPDGSMLRYSTPEEERQAWEDKVRRELEEETERIKDGTWVPAEKREIGTSETDIEARAPGQDAEDRIQAAAIAEQTERDQEEAENEI